MIILSAVLTASFSQDTLRQGFSGALAKEADTLQTLAVDTLAQNTDTPAQLTDTLVQSTDTPWNIDSGNYDLPSDTLVQVSDSILEVMDAARTGEPLASK